MPATQSSNNNPDIEPDQSLDLSRRDFGRIGLAGATLAIVFGDFSGCSRKESQGRTTPLTLPEFAIATRSEISKIYDHQRQKGGTTFAEVNFTLNDVCQHIADRLGPDRFANPPRNYYTSEARAQLATTLFSHGYVFRIGTVGKEGSAFLSAQLYHVDQKPMPFDFPNVQLGSRSFAAPPGLAVHKLTETWVEPYGYASRQLESDATQSTLLIGTHVDELNIILYDSNAAHQYAKLQNLSIEDVPRDVLLNEYGHACLDNFVQGIPNPEGLEIELQGRPFSFHQIDEAFSDYVSLKYGKSDLFGLLARTSQQELNSDYGFSVAVIAIGLSTLRNPYGEKPALLPSDLIPPNTSSAMTQQIILKYLHANPVAAQTARDRLIEIYTILLDKALIGIDSVRG